MLSKVTKLKYLLLKCGYTQQYERENEFLDSLTDRIYVRGNLTPKQAKWANSMYKQFNKNYCHKIFLKSAVYGILFVAL